jgi:23S rRNA (cytosine1962-C5)-methyltransferase
VAAKPDPELLEAGSEDNVSEPPGDALDPLGGVCRPWRDELTLYQDAVWCIVDKPAGVSCEPRDAADIDAPGDLSERLASHYSRRAPTLVSGLPRRASGITLLAFKSQGEQRATRGEPPIRELSAVVAIDGFRLGERGRLRDPASPIGFSVQARSGRRALVRLELGAVADNRSVSRALEALAREGQPVIGDHERGGAAATRLMLHVDTARGRRGFSSELPSAFSSWLEGQPSVAPVEYRGALERAGVLRWGMQRSSDVVRLIDEGGGELSGIGVERYGEYVVLSVSTPAALDVVPDVASELVRLGARGVYLKQRLRADLRRLGASELAPPAPIAGEAAPAELRVRHGELRFDVRLGDGLSTGLFIDQRGNWSRVMRDAYERSVLNLFCYTGAFSVAAAAGGARETLSIDLSARALGQARQNLEQNGFSGEQHRVLKQDVLAWLPRAVAAQQRFDWVILDPPSFGTRQRGVLDSERDYPALVQSCLQLLAPRGRLLCVSHHKRHTHENLAELVQQAGRAVQRELKVWPLVGPWDCPTLPGVSGTKSVLVQAS